MDFQSVNKLFERVIRDHWEKDAMSDYQGGTLKYKELAEYIEHIHIMFGNLGIVPGDKVALCGRNQTGWGAAFLGTMTWGAVPVPILHDFNPDSIGNLVEHSGSIVLFADDLILGKLAERQMGGLKRIVNLSRLDDAFEGDGFKEKFPDGLRPEDLHFHEDKPEDLAIINYTSGTSGFSKGVMLPYRSIMRNIRFSLWAEPEMNSDSTIVSMLPLSHMYGMLFEFMHTIAIGGHLFFLSKTPSPQIILKAFSDVRPGVIIAVPLIIEKVYKTRVKPILERYKAVARIPIVRRFFFRKTCKTLKKAFGGRFGEVILGGAAFNPEVEDFFRKIRFPLTVGYGMTECGPIITYVKWNRSRKGSCGKAVEGCSIRIDSPDPQRIPGEIQIKGDNVFIGYYRNEEATKEAFTADGWFRTGDMGVIDKDGYLYLRGRSKCMILGPSGQNIYPEELEAVINSFNYVADSLVIEEKGTLTALIHPEYRQGELDGMSEEDTEGKIQESLGEINSRLPVYAQIHRIEFMKEDFERTPKRSIKRFLYQRG